MTARVKIVPERLVYFRIYRIAWADHGTCSVRSLVTNALVGSFLDGVWHEDGRLPDDVMTRAMDCRPLE